MIDDFESVKKELTELATVLNTFKSEAVQVRIVELLFGMTKTAANDERPPGSPSALPKRKTKRKTATNATKKEASTKPRRVSTTGTGPTAIVSQLLAGDFFNSPKTIGDIVEHCKHNLARTIKPNEISGKLGRLTRDQKLHRSKNSDGQYEYVNP